MAKAKKSAKKPVKKMMGKKTKKTVKKIAKKSVKKVSAVPVGYNSITPYLIIDRAVDAIQFYKKVFGAKEVMRMGKEDGKKTRRKRVGSAALLYECGHLCRVFDYQ